MARTTTQFVEASIPAGAGRIQGDLMIPEAAAGVVVFAHGSGSSRHSRRNQKVAHYLNDGGLATLLFDLLTPQEQVIDEQTAELRFDIHLLASRLASAVDWVRDPLQATAGMRIGLFGASTGAAAALVTAAERPGVVSAVVSRGGRPDLAAPILHEVQASVLLIVGGDDTLVLDLNKEAQKELQSVNRLEVVSGATHLFEEPGKMETVADLARDWFVKHLVA